MSSDQTSAVCNQAKPKCRCRRYALGCLVVLFTVPLVWWFCLCTVPLRISKETTYVTEPLTADGKRVDYFKALEQKIYPPEMQTDDNGYRLILKHCGHSEYVSRLGGLREQFYEKLALDPNEQPALKLESVEAVFVRLNEDKAKEERQEYERKPWTFEKYPMLEDWLKENTAGIDLLGEAVRKPAFCAPYVRKSENTPMLMLSVVSDLRDYARASANRANYRIATGDIDGAIYDIMTIHRLARFASKHGTLINGLIGLAFDGIAHSIEINGNPDHPLTKEQLERFLLEYESLPPQCTIREVLDTERLFTLGALHDVIWNPSHLDGYEVVSGPLHQLRWMAKFCDLNAMYTFFNRLYDSFDSPDARAAYNVDAGVMYRGTSNPLWFLTVKERTKRVNYAMADLLLPAVGVYEGAVKRCECGGNLKRLTIALLLYEKEHGKLPTENWREAVKPYLGEKPEQYWHCPMPMSKTDYALVISEERTGETPLLVEMDIMNISENGTVPNDSALLACPVPTTPEPQYPHPGVYGISYRNGSVIFNAIRKQREKEKD